MFSVLVCINLELCVWFSWGLAFVASVLPGVAGRDDAISECGVKRGKYPNFTSQTLAIRKMDAFEFSNIEYAVLVVSIPKLKCAIDYEIQVCRHLCLSIVEQIPTVPCISYRNKTPQDINRTSFPLQVYSAPYYLCFILAELVSSLKQRNEVLSLPAKHSLRTVPLF
jgi:hypothetical protein